jgi:hypothetical protein
MNTVSKGILLLKVVLSESEKDLPEYLKGISKANELTDIGSFVSFSTAPNDDRYSKIISLLFPTLLFFFRFFLFLGMAASVIGYVGCFSLIQSSRNNRGPLIWLGAEVGLCFLRLTIWASNPGWDDPPPPPPSLYARSAAKRLPKRMVQRVTTV